METHCREEYQYENEEHADISKFRKRLEERLDNLLHTYIFNHNFILLGIKLIVFRGRNTLITRSDFNFTDPKTNSRILSKRKRFNCKGMLTQI